MLNGEYFEKEKHSSWFTSPAYSEITSMSKRLGSGSVK